MLVHKRNPCHKDTNQLYTQLRKNTSKNTVLDRGKQNI